MKSKFSHCTSCPLYDQEIVIGETNCRDDLKEIDLLILAEAPATTEVDLKRPLMGKAGKIFRRIFSISKLEKVPHYIGNIVFCANLFFDNVTRKRKTRNPPKSAIELCRPNWEMLIKVIEPKYILVLGKSVKDVFNIEGSMEETRGNFYRYEGEKLGLSYDPEIFVTYHPSFIGRGAATTTQIADFENDFKTLYSKITGEEVDKSAADINRDGLKLKSPYFYQIPSWMKTEDIMLVDIQSPPSNDKIIYIFKDKNHKLRFVENDTGEYYYYKGKGTLQNSPVLSSIEDVELIQSRCLEGPNSPVYEGDVKIEMKHSIDYFMQRKNPEPEIPLRKMFFDIEVYTYGDKTFPEGRIAPRPVSAISFKIDDEDLHVFMVDPSNLLEGDHDKINFDEIESEFKVKIFPNEFPDIRLL